MGCICNEIAATDITLAATCVGHLWMFENLQPSELEALVSSAERRQFKKGQTFLCKGFQARKCFLLLTSRAETMSASNLEERLYRVLATVAGEHGMKNKKGTAIQFRLTHEEPGFLVGAHRVSITRAMKNLRNSGKIISRARHSYW